MKTLIVAGLLLMTPLLSAQAEQPFAPDMAETFTKLRVEFDKQQAAATELQRQLNQVVSEIRKVQGQFETACANGAKAANVDLAKFNCDIAKLAFVPKADATAASQTPPAQGQK